MSRIHSDRLNTKRAHRAFAAGVKKTLQETGQVLPVPPGVSPKLLDAEPLSFLVPPGLDRQDLKAHVARRDQTLIFFALAHPDGDDPHTVFVDDLLMSPGTEDYKQARSTDCVERVRRFLDAQLEAPRVV